MDKYLSIGALCLTLAAPAFAVDGTVHFSGAVVSPPCHTSVSSPSRQAQGSELAIDHCGSPAQARLSDARSQAPAAQIRVTDLQGREIDMHQDLSLNERDLRVLVHNLDVRQDSRALLLTISYP